MRVGVRDAGLAGQTIGARLAAVGLDVMLGTPLHNVKVVR